MSDQNGITQTPFADAACPAPSATSGDQGTGGGLDVGSGGNGLSNVPWSGAPVPVPSNTEESGPFGNPSRFASVDGSTQEGTSEMGPVGNITGKHAAVEAERADLMHEERGEEQRVGRASSGLRQSRPR